MQKIGVSERILLDVCDNELCSFEMFDPAKKYDAILIGLDTEITLDLWEEYGCPMILSPTTNISYIPMELWGNVIKLNPKEVTNVSATAEHSFGLFLAACRKMGNDLSAGREVWMGRQVAGMNAAIFGYGRIGTKLKGYCSAFDMNVKMFDKNNTYWDKIEQIKWADVIFISMTYDEETKNFFHMDLIDYFKRGQIIVNTSRAQIVNKELLLKCIDDGIWSYACMDFINYEDKPHDLDEELKKRENIIMTPHIAGNTKESLKIAVETVVGEFLEEAE
ncbi:MAG TPA: NAD(P)-dependent oxidoreductase [Methanosarcinales archaeon]|nr:NAD(P)-dependent oxidoreductase [Methanosarcinales archaeon]